jgi:hypothetical protein
MINPHRAVITDHVTTYNMFVLPSPVEFRLLRTKYRELAVRQ